MRTGVDTGPSVEYTMDSNGKETVMISIRCDACRKDIRDARKDVNYISILGRDLCSSCNDKLRENAGKAWMSRAPMHYAEYQTLLHKTILKMTAG
jgi:hypothetical protein